MAIKHSAFFMVFLATIVQFYDYALFGLSAGILTANFMPIASEDAKLLNFFAIFAFAVIARPIGALIFGYIGDKYSRSASIKIATFLAMISTAFIGLIPNYSTIDYLSTILLLLGRMLFLISQGGEIDLTRIYVAEKIPEHKNLANGVVSFCSQLGALLAASAYHFSLSFKNDYAWRINFILGGIGGLIVLLLRNNLQESEIFLKYKARKSLTQSFDLIKIIKENRLNFLAAIICIGALGGGYNFLIIFLNIFMAKSLNLINVNTAQTMNIILISCYGICAVISGIVADRLNPYKQIIISIILVYMCYIYLSKDFSRFAYFSPIFACLTAFYSVPLQIIVQSLFKIEHRARLCSLSHSIGGIFLSSSIPFFCMLIWQKTDSFTAVSLVYLTLISLVFIVVLASYYRFIGKSNDS